MQYARTGILAVLGFYLFFYLIGEASAFSLSELPQEVGAALGVSETMGGIVLSITILLSGALALSASKKSNNIILTVSVLLGILGMVTALDWLDPWLLILVGLVIALMIGGKMRDWAQSSFGG